MTTRTVEDSPQAYARIAGVLYLVVIAGGLFAEAFVRQRMIEYGDAAATASNILAHEPLYRWAFAVSVFYLACNVPLALVFRRLFKSVNNDIALLVAFFILVATAIEALNLLAHFAPLIFLDAATYSGPFSAEQWQALAYASLRLFGVGFSVCLVFFAFYALSIAYLIYRSDFLPRALGVMMAIAGLCYLTDSFVSFVAPRLAAQLFPYILMPCLVAEASLGLWLAAKGVDVRKWPREAASR